MLKPVYYNQFYCVANKCKFDCCSGWTISIDKATFLKYKKVKGDFGKKLNDNIKRNRQSNSELDYGEIKNKDKRCPFLNKDGLCDIYINLGEKYLSETCTKYPRSIKIINDICEKNLNTSCPEVVRILMEIKNPLEFTIEEEKIENPTINKIPNKLYDLVWKGRDFSIELAQFREISIWKRLIFIKIAGNRLEELMINSNYKEVDNTINELEREFTSLEVIKSLDDIGTVPQVKLTFIKSIIKARENFNNMNQVFLKLLEEFHEYICKEEDGNDEELIKYLTDAEEIFLKYFKNKEYILEHYIVINLFKNYFYCIKDKNIDMQIVKLILMYAVIKYLLISRWIKNNENLNDDDIIEIIHSVSRELGHFNSFMDNIYKAIKKEGFDTLAYLAILIK